MIQPANKKHCKIKKKKRQKDRGKRKPEVMIDNQHPTVGSTRKGGRKKVDKRVRTKGEEK